MTRRAAKVVLLHLEASSKVEDCIKHIELRRSANAMMAVWGSKYGQDPVTGRRRSAEWNKTKGLKSLMATWKAIEAQADLLDVTVEPGDAIPLIASIDWLTATVIASKLGLQLPELPNMEVLRTQRSLRTIGRVTIGAEWGYDMHDLTLPFERWIGILGGEHFIIDEPYWYEGQRFTGTWTFDGDRRLEVSYDDGGIGWVGELMALDLMHGPIIDEIDVARLALSAVERRERTKGGVKR